LILARLFKAGRPVAVVLVAAATVDNERQNQPSLPRLEIDALVFPALKTCHYPNFVTKYVCCILARDSGRQNKAWGGAQRNPRYDVDLSLKPAKRAAAIGPISMMMK
jgi:hypothetical protein